MQLIDEGIEPERIDEAAKNFGMLMGPLEMADTVGLDICLAVSKNLVSHFGGTVSETLIHMVDEGKLGRKTGEGFYCYKKGKIIKKKLSTSTIDEEIAERLILRMINESLACLHEGVVENADLLDAAMIFGTGFAPFRGGPINYAKSLGQEELKEQFSKLRVQYGERFNPKMLTELG
jgi:3-hydroxyacyl-CoA dehydrogenase / enoyl-CoA hydratase / 3-hydroxybutyryl-CoA epimerase